ncbi:hypothetical protein EC392_07180 [Lonsdalea populi]|uniref:GNAT family N-acetyltransferase n=1 Tax=Lonsdalea populi TaxID=1172565 RepID=A0A3N0ULP9_9GAMM|nr:hypothetical protein EC393_06965 [Lonsdalea populi]ROH81198.1 hypothetical protein EC392_07180 [Lonsdalea populi]ROH81691.1 hypothetical protein EC394_07305 [Lonsdalea populi]
MPPAIDRERATSVLLFLSLLDWNQPAIAFYQSIGALPQEDWGRQKEVFLRPHLGVMWAEFNES